MNVICTDGTTLQCDRFEAIDSGVLLFEESQGREATEEETEDEEEEEEELNAVGFVPSHQIKYVLSEQLQSRGRTAQRGAPTGVQSGSAMPTGSTGQPPTQQTGAPAQQSTRGAPPGTTGQPPGTGGQPRTGGPGPGRQ